MAPGRRVTVGQQPAQLRNLRRSSGLGDDVGEIAAGGNRLHRRQRGRRVEGNIRRARGHDAVDGDGVLDGFAHEHTDQIARPDTVAAQGVCQLV